ncbi:MAG: proton-conducting transporter membrane subunit, partial [bacterium]
MALLLSAIALVAFSGVPALVGRGRGGGIAAALAMIGAATGLVFSTLAFLRGDLVSYFHAWPIPYAAFSVGLDPLSSFFLIPIFLLTALSALYGRAYMRGRAGAGRSPLFFGLLAAGMAMVVIARNGMLFLISWEMMAIASFFLVTLDDDRANVRRAGITYLVATHIGTAFLLALFALMAAHAGSMEFSEWKGAAASLPSAGALFILALVGFGTKAGFMPLHVWLPEAHPAAPSHVSALMSGVMIKTGIYGLMRILTLLGAPPEWWGWTLIAIGAISGVMGVLYALAQHELKALLAYHSVENIGIIAIGFGLGLFGVSRGMPVVAFLGFGGALLHVLNHAIFKGLLFLGAGAVIRASGTGEIDRLGGLLKRMPHTAAAFLVGSAAISGLPPLNGFVSEFLIYLGAFAILVTPGATI